MLVLIFWLTLGRLCLDSGVSGSGLGGVVLLGRGPDCLDIDSKPTHKT